MDSNTIFVNIFLIIYNTLHYSHYYYYYKTRSIIRKINELINRDLYYKIYFRL